MSNYPAQIDTSQSLPPVIDNVTPAQGSTVNSLRDAILAIESELGIKPSGVYGTVRARLDALEAAIASLQIIRLDQDLGGTLDLPKVVGLQGHPISTITPSINDVLTWNGVAWRPAPSSGGGGGTVIFAGDLSGSSTTQTVVGLQGKPISVTVPTTGQALVYNGSVWIPGDSFTAGGDLSGTPTSQTVVGLQGNDVSSNAPSNGDVLTWNSFDGQWIPAADLDFFYNSVVINYVDGLTNLTATLPTIYTINSLIGDSGANLPALPHDGLSLIIADKGGSIGKFKFTIHGNGNNINGASTFVMGAVSGSLSSYLFVYSNAGGEWVVSASYTPNGHSPVTNASSGVTMADNGPNTVWIFSGLADSSQKATLPKHPVTGETHTIMDTDGSLTSFNYTIDGGGTIVIEAPDGTTATTLVMTSANIGAGGSITLMYVGSAGWRIV